MRQREARRAHLHTEAGFRRVRKQASALNCESADASVTSAAATVSSSAASKLRSPVREVATQGIPFASRAATHARPVPPPAPSTSTGLAVAADAMVTGLLDTAAAPSTTASRRPGPFVTSASARPRSPAADIFAEKCFFFSPRRVFFYLKPDRRIRCRAKYVVVARLR